MSRFSRSPVLIDVENIFLLERESKVCDVDALRATMTMKMKMDEIYLFSINCESFVESAQAKDHDILLDKHFLMLSFVPRSLHRLMTLNH